MSNGFKQGWEDGYKWFQKNCHVDKQGYYNVRGDKVTTIMETFINKPKGYDAGFTEGIKFGCGQKPIA